LKNTYYFSHDGNARNDPKILSMRSVYGTEGYGWYWIIIEMLREQENYKIKINKYTWNALAMQMQCTADAAQSFASDCINEFELLHSDGEYFWSNSLLKRMEVKDSKSEKARKAAEARWNKKDRQNNNSSKSENGNESGSAKDEQTQSERNASAMPKKEKESKEKKRKEKDYCSSNESNPFSYFENNFGVLNQVTVDSINQWIDDLGEELVVKAMEKAALGGKSFSYANGILKDWYRNNIRTLDDVEAEEKKHFRNKEGTKIQVRSQPEDSRYSNAF